MISIMNYQNLEAINRVLYHIHTASNLNFKVGNLAKISGYSRFHFARVFREIFDESVSEYIIRFRLEFAALQLLQNREKKIVDIAYEAGFASSSTFNAYFKKYFQSTPKQWRQTKLQMAMSLDFTCFEKISHSIKYVPKFGVLYLRHKGYDRTIQEVWERLLVCLNMQKDEVSMIGVHHNYPIITPKEQCHYVACIKSEQRELARGKVGFGYTNEGYYGIFSFQGKRGDILKFMDYLYLEWFYKNGYGSDNRVPMVIYKRNHFLEKENFFDIDFYLPIKA